MKLLGNAADIELVVESAFARYRPSKSKATQSLTPLQKAYTALILRHNDLQQTLGLAQTLEERIKMQHFMQAYEEALATLEEYRDFK